MTFLPRDPVLRVHISQSQRRLVYDTLRNFLFVDPSMPEPIRSGVRRVHRVLVKKFRDPAKPPGLTFCETGLVHCTLQIARDAVRTAVGGLPASDPDFSRAVAFDRELAVLVEVFPDPDELPVSVSGPLSS